MKIIRIWISLMLLGGFAKSSDDPKHDIHEENITSLYAYSSGWHIQAYRDLLKISAGTTFLEVAVVPADKYTISDMFERLSRDMKPRDGDNLQRDETWLNIRIDGSNESIVKIVRRDRMEDFLVDLIKVAVPNNRSIFTEALKKTPLSSARTAEIKEVIERLEREEAESGSTKNPIGSDPSNQSFGNHRNFGDPKASGESVRSARPETPEKDKVTGEKNELTQGILLISGVGACCLALVAWLRCKQSSSP